MKTTERVKIVTGLKCNIQCVFCYYRDNLKAPNRPFEAIKRDLEYSWRHGIREVDFSGGEPTVHPDLPKLIAAAKTIGFRRVCIISNGLRLADKGYVRTLKDSGLDEILFSVHGPSDSVHDQITMVPGSFSRLATALAHAAGELITVRTNTVVNRINYRDLNDIATLVCRFNPRQVNFITVNDWCYAKHLVDKLMLPYSEMQAPLKEACSRLQQQVPAVNVRYIPFCFMEGYEQFVCNHAQLRYDLFEWVPRVRARLEVQNTIWRYLAIVAYGFTRGGAFKKLFSLPFREVIDESVINAIRSYYYVKSSGCSRCKFDKICDGVEKTYAKQYGLNELSSRPGGKISHPWHYRG